MNSDHERGQRKPGWRGVHPQTDVRWSDLPELPPLPNRERGQRETTKQRKAREEREKDEQALDQEADMYPCENPYDPLTGWKE